MTHFISLGVLAFLCLAQAGMSQTANGSISGRVASEDGRALRAIVTAQPAPQAGSAAMPNRRVSTALDGSFTFQQLPAGTYGLCAQVPGEQVRKGDPPFLDTCQWAQMQNVKIAAGQALGSVQLLAPGGALLQVRVNDPDSVLVQAQRPLTYDPHIQLTVAKPGGQLFYLPVSAQDKTGRTHAMAVPYGTSLSLSVTGTQASVLDSTGKPAQAAAPLQFPKGSTPQIVVLTIHKQ